MIEDLSQIVTNKGRNLASLSESGPVMVIFLRHFGCIFCQEALKDISSRKLDMEKSKTKVVFIHMAENNVAEEYFEKFGLAHAEHVSNPDCSYYIQFGLTKGTFGQLFGLQTWRRGFKLKSEGLDFKMKSVGDSFQMPGIFLVHEGKVKDSYIHTKASDKPDYKKLLNCCVA